jgi:hypothetical protein
MSCISSWFAVLAMHNAFSRRVSPDFEQELGCGIFTEIAGPEYLKLNRVSSFGRFQ